MTQIQYCDAVRISWVQIFPPSVVLFRRWKVPPDHNNYWNVPFVILEKKCINDLSVEGYSLCLSLKMLKLSNSLFCPYNPLPIFFSLFFEIHGKSYLWHFYKKSILLFLSFMRYKSIKTIPMQSLWKFERDLIFRKISKVKYLKKK